MSAGPLAFHWLSIARCLTSLGVTQNLHLPPSLYLSHSNALASSNGQPATLLFVVQDTPYVYREACSVCAPLSFGIALRAGLVIRRRLAYTVRLVNPGSSRPSRQLCVQTPLPSLLQSWHITKASTLCRQKTGREEEAMLWRYSSAARFETVGIRPFQYLNREPKSCAPVSSWPNPGN